MKLIKYPLWFCYRVWFYILVALPIIILFPLLLLSISRPQWYPQFFKLARFWAHFILIGMGFRYRVNSKASLDSTKSYMFIANHTSMADIMLMLVAVKNPFVFVGKKELSKIPLFGFFYKRTCILVDRSDLRSRQAVFESAQERLNRGLSVCIFPEGGVPDEEIVLDEFKDGAFRLAINHQIPVVPIVFYDNKQRFSYTFFSGGPGRMRAEIKDQISTNTMSLKDIKPLRNRSREIILKALQDTP